MTMQVLLAEDHQIIRQGLRCLLEEQCGARVIAEAIDGRSAVQLAGELAPDVVIMDISLPDLNGIEATRQLVQANPDVKVIALSVHCESDYVTAMFQAGACAYLVKDCAFEELRFALEAAARNRKYISPSIAHVLLDRHVREAVNGEVSAFSMLTAREREVLQLVAEGRATKEIAGHLHLGEKTIETHRQNTMKKLGIHTIAGLTKYAIRQGLTTLSPR